MSSTEPAHGGNYHALRVQLLMLGFEDFDPYDQKYISMFLDVPNICLPHDPEQFVLGDWRIVVGYEQQASQRGRRAAFYIAMIDETDGRIIGSIYCDTYQEALKYIRSALGVNIPAMAKIQH